MRVWQVEQEFLSWPAGAHLNPSPGIIMEPNHCPVSYPVHNLVNVNCLLFRLSINYRGMFMVLNSVEISACLWAFGWRGLKSQTQMTNRTTNNPKLEQLSLQLGWAGLGWAGSGLS